jgi:tRNA(Ile)-lysidine synthase
VKAMEQGAVGSRFPASAVDVHVDREAFLVVPVPPAAREWSIADAHHPPVDLPLRMSFVDAADIDPNAGATVLWLDAERLEFPLTLRPWRAGDRLEPSGMAGSKLVSDLLIDAKFPRYRKDRVLVLCDAQRILWCCGVRAAGYARATSKSKRVLRVELGII